MKRNVKVFARSDKYREGWDRIFGYRANYELAKKLLREEKDDPLLKEFSAPFNSWFKINCEKCRGPFYECDQ